MKTAMTGPVTSFEQLELYQRACDLDLSIFELSKRWPKEEHYSLTDQIRRASRSVGANISEAWAKRRYPAHFTSKLTDADGELQETRHWLMRSRAYGYITEDELTKLMGNAEEVGRRLGRMMASGAWF
jgi:four helix bundle protein